MSPCLSTAHTRGWRPGRNSTGGFQPFNLRVGSVDRKKANSVPTLPTLPTLFSTPSPEVGGGEGGHARVGWNRRAAVAGWFA